MRVNEASHLYCPLTPGRVQEVCRYYLGASAVSARLLGGGLFNTTYLLETASQRVVLRLGPVNRSRLLPYESRLMEAEAGLMRLLQAHGIPTSSLLVCDTSRSYLDRDVMLVQYLPADALVEYREEKELTARLTREVGSLAQRMHRITASELPKVPEKPFGRYASILDGRGAASWSEAIVQEVAEWRACATRTGLFPGEVLEQVRCCFARYVPLLDQVGQTPYFVHADLWAGNVLVDRDNHLAAVIDCDRALFGDPEFEFATDWMINRAFLQGYGRQPDSSPEARLRRKLYKLMLDLEDCFILATEYHNPPASRDLAGRILMELDQLMSCS